MGHDGGRIAGADLPSPDTKRWVIRRKAEVVAAVRSGLLSLEQACSRYALNIEEFRAWERSIDRFGVKGLRTTQTQFYLNFGGGMRVLLIEDHRPTAQPIELILRAAGFNVYTTDLGGEGIDLGKLYDYDIILLDLDLPDMSGFEALRTLRVSKVRTPILILTGVARTEDKITGLGYGADDYMTKPFHQGELLARLHAIVRRSKGHTQSIIIVGDLCVNIDAKTVEISGVPVQLTRKEYQMLELLSLRKGSMVSKEMFLNNLYGGIDEPAMKILDVFICKLRKKLVKASNGKDYIETVWGGGWMLRQPSEHQTSLCA